MHCLSKRYIWIISWLNERSMLRYCHLCCWSLRRRWRNLFDHYKYINMRIMPCRYIWCHDWIEVSYMQWYCHMRSGQIRSRWSYRSHKHCCYYLHYLPRGYLWFDYRS